MKHKLHFCVPPDAAAFPGIQLIMVEYHMLCLIVGWTECLRVMEHSTAHVRRSRYAEWKSAGSSDFSRFANGICSPSSEVPPGKVTVYTSEAIYFCCILQLAL